MCSCQTGSDPVLSCCFLRLTSKRVEATQAHQSAYLDIFDRIHCQKRSLLVPFLPCPLPLSLSPSCIYFVPLLSPLATFLHLLIAPLLSFLSPLVTFLHLLCSPLVYLFLLPSCISFVPLLSLFLVLLASSSCPPSCTPFLSPLPFLHLPIVSPLVSLY